MKLTEEIEKKKVYEVEAIVFRSKLLYSQRQRA